MSIREDRMRLTSLRCGSCDQRFRERGRMTSSSDWMLRSSSPYSGFGSCSSRFLLLERSLDGDMNFIPSVGRWRCWGVSAGLMERIDDGLEDQASGSCSNDSCSFLFLLSKRHRKEDRRWSGLVKVRPDLDLFPSAGRNSGDIGRPRMVRTGFDVLGDFRRPGELRMGFELYPGDLLGGCSGDNCNRRKGIDLVVLGLASKSAS